LVPQSHPWNLSALQRVLFGEAKKEPAHEVSSSLPLAKEPDELCSSVLFSRAEKEPLCVAQNSVPKALEPATF
jgi:hypothetical protein